MITNKIMILLPAVIMVALLLIFGINVLAKNNVIKVDMGIGDIFPNILLLDKYSPDAAISNDILNALKKSSISLS